ncbi:MAG TPA: hypothetical protein VFR81_15385 [Longimicrobium sp.]|nr:hypothetical protein [Longimicrobium sp.]
MSETPPIPPGPGGPPSATRLGVQLPGPIVDDRCRAHRIRLQTVIAGTPEQHRESAKNDGRTAQSSLLVMARVRAGHYEKLERLLADMRVPPGGEDLELNPVIPFRRLPTIHFARLLLHAPSPSDAAPIPVFDGKPQAHGPAIPAKLLFSTDFDGTLEEHVDELLCEAGPGLDQVFGHCEGWPGHADREAAHAFFHGRRVPTNTFYTGTMGRSVDQIRREADLRDRIQRFLDAETGKPDFPADPVAIRRRIVDFAFGEEALSWVREEPGPYPGPIVRNFNRAVIVAAAVLLVAAVALLSLAVPWTTAILVVLGVVAVLAGVVFAAFSYLKRLAATDPVIIRPTVDQHTSRLVETEDRIVQNEMSSVIYIKEPLWFRGLVLRAVLAFINFSAKYLSNQGSLAGIPSIHFARWVIVDEGRRLVFFSNFDGSWENYLGDFIDKSASGLTAVWSNCVGFPRTKGLTGEGARDEQKFKDYSRDSQIPTQVWYSAYRWLSVSNINNNSKIRLGLYGAMEAAEATAWLRRFADGGERAFNPQPDPPSPDAAAPPAIEVDDVQGLVARSYAPLRHAAYVPARFSDDAAGARAWVGALADEVTAAAARSGHVQERGHALNLAFTSDGLRALGMSKAEVATFSREFQEGMATEHRKRVLGDTGPAAPELWRWGGPRNDRIDAMLFVYAATPERLTELLERERARAIGSGVSLGEPLGTIMLADDKEHFGFHDGIAQPRIAGLSQGKGEIPAGEVVLGYPNAYGKLPSSPSVAESGAARRFLKPVPADPDAPNAPPRRDLGRNGTYVVFRQLEQDVRAFWKWVDERAEHDAARRKKLAAKMVGRWPNGAPLVQHPDEEPAKFDSAKGNSFLYSKDDLHGERCPIASHIRRSNPRDGMMPNARESLLVADRHRLLRRGRAYGPPLAASFDPADVLRADDPANGDRGLHFICFNSDIVRQFEFVQNTWINGMKFDGLYAEPDPVVGPHVDPADAKHPEQVSAFTEPRCPVRHREMAIPRFVTMRGGAYLFMPGVSALRYLSSLE